MLKKLVFLFVLVVLICILIGCQAANKNGLPDTNGNVAALIPELPTTVQNTDVAEDDVTIYVWHHEDEAWPCWFIVNAENEVLAVDWRSDQKADTTMDVRSHTFLVGTPYTDVYTVPFSTSFTCQTEPIGKDVKLWFSVDEKLYTFSAQGCDTVTFSVDGVRFTGENITYSLGVANEENSMIITGQGENELCLLRDGETFSLTTAHDCEVSVQNAWTGKELIRQSVPAYRTLTVENMDCSEVAAVME